jgi:hypothetical protein
LSAKQLFQRVEREYLFDVCCSAFDSGKQFQIDEALRASIREIVLAKLKGEIADSPAEEDYRSSARQRLQRSGQEDLFEEISRRVSTMRVREVIPPVLANSPDELQSLQPICDDLFKVLRPSPASTPSPGVSSATSCNRAPKEIQVATVTSRGTRVTLRFER